MDCSLPASSVHGISWARILEWVFIFSQIRPLREREREREREIFIYIYILLARCQHLKYELVGFSDDLCGVD